MFSRKFISMGVKGQTSFVYSKKEDSVYCINCALFSPTDTRRALGSFVNTGYKGWKKIHEKQTLHICIFFLIKILIYNITQ